MTEKPNDLEGPADNHALRISPLDRRRMEMVLTLSGLTKTELFTQALREACRARLVAFAAAESPDQLREALKEAV